MEPFLRTADDTSCRRGSAQASAGVIAKSTGPQQRKNLPVVVPLALDHDQGDGFPHHVGSINPGDQAESVRDDRRGNLRKSGGGLHRGFVGLGVLTRNSIRGGNDRPPGTPMLGRATTAKCPRFPRVLSGFQGRKRLVLGSGRDLMSVLAGAERYGIEPFEYVRQLLIALSSADVDLGTLSPDVWIAAHPGRYLQRRDDEAEAAAISRKRRRGKRRAKSKARPPEVEVVPGRVHRTAGSAQ